MPLFRKEEANSKEEKTAVGRNEKSPVIKPEDTGTVKTKTPWVARLGLLRRIGSGDVVSCRRELE